MKEIQNNNPVRAEISMSSFQASRLKLLKIGSNLEDTKSKIDELSKKLHGKKKNNF